MSSPYYGGLRLTPQLGLVPISPDPASGLWEFAHFATGEPAQRGADGKISLRPETGLVLVLLPGGRVPVADSEDQGQNLELTKIEPFFLSKYEMTEGQWKRIGGWLRKGRDGIDPLTPKYNVSWDDCRLALDHGGWLRLPTEAQWEFGCRAGTKSRWWTGSQVESLKGAANIDFGDRRDMQRIGLLRPNPFGLHDVVGNLREWCGDDADYLFSRGGDGLRAGGGAFRVNRGHDYWFEAETAPSRPKQVDALAPGDRNIDLGLRPARGITP